MTKTVTENQLDLFHVVEFSNQMPLDRFLVAKKRIEKKIVNKKGAIRRILISIKDEEVSLNLINEKIASYVVNQKQIAN